MSIFASIDWLSFSYGALIGMAVPFLLMLLVYSVMDDGPPEQEPS